MQLEVIESLIARLRSMGPSWHLEFITKMGKEAEARFRRTAEQIIKTWKKIGRFIACPLQATSHASSECLPNNMENPELRCRLAKEKLIHSENSGSTFLNA